MDWKLRIYEPDASAPSVGLELGTTSGVICGAGSARNRSDDRIELRSTV
jgi:hypothetical protein